MNQKFKSGKKVLSLVLSVLMLMSCLVFAPVANAAETLPKSDVDIVFDCTNERSLRNGNNGTFTLRVEFEDENSKTIDLFGYNGKDIREGGFLTRKKIGEKKTTFTITGVTSKVKAVFMAMNINCVTGGPWGILKFKISVSQNENSLGTYSYKSDDGQNKFRDNKYILGGDIAKVRCRHCV